MTNNGSDGGFGSDDDLEHTFSAQGVCVCKFIYHNSKQNMETITNSRI